MFHLLAWQSHHCMTVLYITVDDKRRIMSAGYLLLLAYTQFRLVKLIVNCWNGLAFMLSAMINSNELFSDFITDVFAF